jgi:hypothetical protein
MGLGLVKGVKGLALPVGAWVGGLVVVVVGGVGG